MQVTTVDNIGRSRFEVYADRELAGYTYYRIRNGRMSILRTWTDPKFHRLGLASAVVRAALESARSRDLEVLPYCDFVSWYIGHVGGEYFDLVPEEERERFGLRRSAA
jgi:predicted GNAT family acetyltransferase